MPSDLESPGDLRPLRVLYSFPFRIGAGQICHTAFQQVTGLERAGVDVTLATGSVAKPLPAGVSVTTTLSCWKIRIPFKLFGTQKMCRLHD